MNIQKITKITNRSYGQLIVNKAAKVIKWEKDILCNKWCWKNWISIQGKKNFNLFRTSYTKLIKNETQQNTVLLLNIRAKPIKLQEEKYKEIFMILRQTKLSSLGHKEKNK